MKSVALVTAAALLALVPAATATATDFYAPETPSITAIDEGFDWEGLYVGATGAIYYIPGLGFGDPGFLKVLGVNVVPSDNLLVGVEARAGAYFDGGLSFWEIGKHARIGAIVGDDVLVYGVAGVIYSRYGPGSFLWEAAIGGGAEIALGDKISLRAELSRRFCVGGNVLCVAGGANHLDAGVVWHLD